MEKTEIASIKKMFDSLSENGQWLWLIHTDLKEHFTVYLDNDNTHIYFAADDNADYCMAFKNDIGDRSGVYSLIAALGVDVRGV